MIIVNFSTSQYLKGQKRLSDSISEPYLKLMFTQYEIIGSPTHQQSPYEFKIHAIEKAFEIDPIVLWVDSSMWRVGDLSIIENLIKQDGYFLSEAGHYAGRWTNDFARSYFQVTEKEMKQEQGGITMFSAGLLGLNIESEIAMEFFRQWKASAIAGTFKGDWSNHRHDMTAGSIIASRLGMKYQRGGQHMAYIGPGYSEPESNVIFYLQGL
jgi:hypothetical protein